MRLDPHLNPLPSQREADNEVAAEGCLRWPVRLRLENHDAKI
jgi:hypothetical protein